MNTVVTAVWLLAAGLVSDFDIDLDEQAMRWRKKPLLEESMKWDCGKQFVEREGCIRSCSEKEK